MKNDASLISSVQQSTWIRNLLPASIKSVIRRYTPYAEIRSLQLRIITENRFDGRIPESFNPESNVPFKIGIISDAAYAYANHIAACLELGIRFQVIDIMADNWIERIEDSECQGFMAVPSTLLGFWRRVFEERLWVLKNDLGKILCPEYRELYIWESKRRMHDWLVSHKIPHPETHVFTERDEAITYIGNAKYPLICKTDSGAAASGIFLLKSPAETRRMIDKAFSRGILGRYSDSRDREYGSIFLQSYIPHDYEWRIVRIGEDYLCRRKTRIGDFASGSGDIDWAEPLQGMLDFVRNVTDAGEFRCMSLDIFEAGEDKGDCRFLVNELQTIIGFKEVPMNPHTGCWNWDPVHQNWSFRHGAFHQNACGNLRVKLLLDRLTGMPPQTVDTGHPVV